MAKRKADVLDREQAAGLAGGIKKLATQASGVQSSFAPALFTTQQLSRYSAEYAASTPYKHAVVSPLIADDLLRSVRQEIVEHVDFTPKETDIYKIHQSGDLANLSGLSATALEKLPSLLKLRDALYGKEFRSWISTVATSGPLSGKKTDMAINVYVPGCHLLCHDDVIGTRRVSYILYLTDPEKPWEARWGGALRLHATDTLFDKDGKAHKQPRAAWEKTIPPAWNQLSFFTVQPGESFHDVEEVYHRSESDSTDDGGRVRMAISGWFHIPQEGEEGFEPGLEAKLAQRSSLAQLQGKADDFDEPQTIWHEPQDYQRNGDVADDDDDDELSESDLQFLIKYMTPNYLTPDTVEELNEIFTEESTLQLSDFLSKKFAIRLQSQLSSPSPAFANSWQVSRPPHKHRFEFMHPPPANVTGSASDPFGDLLTNLLPSLAFRKWLALVTGLSLQQCATIARHFRRGLDYQLAQDYTGDDPQLEYTLCVTPSDGWAAEDERADAADNVGGYELYMAGDDDDGDSQHDDGTNAPTTEVSQTGAGKRRSAQKADPAIYRAAQDDEDDGILFSNPASWNTLSLVLRDRGVLRFVKYVSNAAKGDRWDITGAYRVLDEEDDDDGNKHNAHEEAREDEFAGFAD